MSVAAPYWPQKYRAEREACGRELTSELLEISDDIDDPVIKLQFLRGAIDGQDSYERRVQRVPFAPIRRALFRLHGLRALAPALANADLESQEIVHYRMLAARTRVRRLLGGAVCSALLVTPLLLAGVAWQWNSRPAQPTAVAALSPTPPAVAAPAPSAPAPVVQPVVLEAPVMPAPPVAEFLPEDSLGQTPSEIFLADKGEDWEVYSNGLRIETAFTVAGRPRSYRTVDRDGGFKSTRHTQPVGILFHTSESDLWAIEPKNERRLRQSSTEVLKYVQRNRSYNYLIDRFGRVYRVVADETLANHAGNSVWAQGDDVYLDLNAAFIGISFESRWQAKEGESPEGRALPITRAQLIAGRNLTNYLRQRFEIAPEMCVTHGITSISPRSFLIGYHRDWATGFPFAAFGLPDQYAEPPASVTLFGFEHDGDYLRAVGKLTPGLITAGRMLTMEAQNRGITVDALRQERRARYEKLRAQMGSRTAVTKPAPIQQVAVK